MIAKGYFYHEALQKPRDDIFLIFNETKVSIIIVVSFIYIFILSDYEIS